MAKEVTEEKSLKLLKQGKIDKIPKKFFSDKEFIIKAIKLVGGDDVIKRASESIKKECRFC